MEVTKRVLVIMKDPELQKKLANIVRDEEYNIRILKETMNRFKEMEECLVSCRAPNPEITPLCLNWAFNSMSREKCLREVQKAMAIYMENIKCCLVFFNKANGSKIIPPVPIIFGVMEVQFSSGYFIRTMARPRL